MNVSVTELQKRNEQISKMFVLQTWIFTYYFQTCD